MRTFPYFLFLNKILFFHNFALGLCISGVWNFQRSTGSNGCIKWIRNPRPENQCGLVFCAGPKERKVSDKSLKKKQSTFNVIKYCKSFQFHSVEISWFDVEIWRFFLKYNVPTAMILIFRCKSYISLFLHAYKTFLKTNSIHGTFTYTKKYSSQT